MNKKLSKPLGKYDKCGFEFHQEMLKGDETYGINFDRVQWDSKYECYVIIELLRCREEQQVSPYESHPNKYFYKNPHKFTSLWTLTQKLEGKLYLVNYAKKGTQHADKVLVMEVSNIDASNQKKPVQGEIVKTNREKYSQWLRKINKRARK